MSAAVFGVSYIVDRIFFDVLIDGVLKYMFPAEKFPSDNDELTPWEDITSCCVAYIGGGNGSSKNSRANFWSNVPA